MTKLDIRKASVREREEAARRAAERAQRQERGTDTTALWALGRVAAVVAIAGLALLPSLEQTAQGRRLWLQIQAWIGGGDPRLIHAANTPYGSVVGDPFSPIQWDLLAAAAGLGTQGVWALGLLGIAMAVAAWALRPVSRHLGGGFLLGLALVWALHDPLAAPALLATGLAAWAVHGPRLGGAMGAFLGPVLLGAAAALAPALAPLFLAMGVAIAAMRARRLHTSAALGFLVAGLATDAHLFLALSALALLPAFLAPRKTPHRRPLPLVVLPALAVMTTPPPAWQPIEAAAALAVAMACLLAWIFAYRHAPLAHTHRPAMAAALAGSLALGATGVRSLLVGSAGMEAQGMDGSTLLALWTIGVGALWLPAWRGWGNNLHAAAIALCAGLVLYTPTPNTPYAPTCTASDLDAAVDALERAGIRRVATDPMTGYALLARGAPFSVVAAGLGDEGDKDVVAILQGDDPTAARRLLLQRSVGAVLVCGTPPQTGLAHALWDGGGAALAPTSAWMEAGPATQTTAIGWITIGLEGTP